MYCEFLEDWKGDQYRWFQNGDKKLPTSCTEKNILLLIPPEGHNPEFKRHSYTLLDSKKLSTLVHSLGDNTIGSQHPHGNSKSEKPHVRTCPSVLWSISKNTRLSF